jgi:hypothetical protein
VLFWEVELVMNPVVVHVVRPYASEQEYLSAEAWSIDARSMLLVDAEALPNDTAVLFDVALTDGHKPIRAEGRVVGNVAASGDRPGGLKVRFKRFGAATKAFIERAVKLHGAGSEPDRPSLPNSLPEVERISLLEAELASAPIAVPPTREPSGTRQRAPGPVTAPANRDELLARLRERQRSA